jgi:hypothetical protein
MNFKLVSKQNMGIVLFLLLAIIISQSRMFDFLFNTALGRSFFLILLLIISYCNKILGVVTVLLVIIMMNNRDEMYYYYEGFTDASGNKMEDASGNRVDASGNRVDASGNRVAKMAAIKHAKSTKSSDSTTTEGFDLLGTENSLKRGKTSNSIPVNNSVRKSGNVDPYSSSSFANDSYSMF